MKLFVVFLLAATLVAQDDAKRIVPFQGRRLALVIGNKDYSWKPLANPVNDAADVAMALERDGFARGDVHLVTNAGERAMKRAVREFVGSVKPGDLAFVYYSGHGVEVKGTNYLLPIDIPADATEAEVEDEAISAQRIANDLGDQGAAVKVLVLDACRDNPLRATRSAGGGLGPMEGLGSLIVFATQAGHTASDNTTGRNGLFTQYLLKALTMKNVSLDDAFRDVARQMAAETSRRQIPAIYGLLERPVMLVSAPASRGATPVPLAPDPALEAWAAIKDSKNVQDYDDYAANYPSSPYATPAKMAANRLRREAAVPPGSLASAAGNGGANREFDSRVGQGQQQAQVAKIAVIAFQQTVSQTNEFKRDFDGLQKKYDPKRQELKTLSDEIDNLTKRSQGANISDAERQSLTRTISDKKKRLQRDGQDAQEDFQKDMQEVYTARATKVYDVLNAYVRANGYTIVLDTSAEWPKDIVLFATDPRIVTKEALVANGTDITQEIINRYNSKSP